MIRKEQVRIGMRIVGDDPESPESYPYKGTVTALCETGRNETDFYIVIKLDGESMRQPEISRCCPEGIMRCFPWTVSPEENRKTKQYPFHGLYGRGDIPGFPLLHPYGRRQEEPPGIPSGNGRQLFRAVIRPGTGMRL